MIILEEIDSQFLEPFHNGDGEGLMTLATLSVPHNKEKSQQQHGKNENQAHELLEGWLFDHESKNPRDEAAEDQEWGNVLPERIEDAQPFLFFREMPELIIHLLSTSGSLEMKIHPQRIPTQENRNREG